MSDESEAYTGIYVDGKPCADHAIPEGPLYLVWSASGQLPVRYLFTRLSKATRAATRMAERFNDKGQVFFVAHLLSWHQHQAGPAMGNMKLDITGFGERR